MRFSEYLSAGNPDTGTGGTVDRVDLICFEDGTCINRSQLVIGRPFPATRQPRPVQQARNFLSNDGTGGPIIYGREEQVYPARDDGTGGPGVVRNPQAGRDFAALLDLLRRTRGR